MKRRAGLLLMLTLLSLASSLLGGCAMVQVQSLDTRKYIATKRGDILTTGHLSAVTQETIRVAGLNETACAKPAQSCIRALAESDGLIEERRWSALAELWLRQAMVVRASPRAASPDSRVDAWLETARYAYLYLFFSPRSPGQRAFEDRQTQVRDYYNYAVQEAVTALFQRRGVSAEELASSAALHYFDWTIHVDHAELRLPEGVTAPKELIPATSLSFAGLRSIYRRDGFGAEFVAVMSDDPVAASLRPISGRGANEQPSYSEIPSPALTVLFRFPGESAAEVLATRDLLISAHDPYREADIELRGQRVPLGANFTAGYGLWLARSDFAGQSLRTLFGRARGLERPHVYMMQPYDPQRRIIIMLHGLASSPEAWVNVANEVLGDELLRRHFQVWQVYYPTNLPLAVNLTTIRHAITETLGRVDPDGTAPASRDLVLIGHSMGGVLSRLLISSSGERLWQELLPQRSLDEQGAERLRALLYFEPLAGVNRAIFIAAPHRGTDVAGQRLGRLVRSFVRLPLALFKELENTVRGLGGNNGPAGATPIRIPNSIDNLDAADPFVRAAATLPMSSGVLCHSIIARTDSRGPLEQSDDGLVPYWSAHLDNAVSEKVLVSGHSVQETAAAILEVRRILREDISGISSRPISAALRRPAAGFDVAQVMLSSP